MATEDMPASCTLMSSGHPVHQLMDYAPCLHVSNCVPLLASDQLVQHWILDQLLQADAMSCGHHCDSSLCNVFDGCHLSLITNLIHHNNLQ